MAGVPVWSPHERVDRLEECLSVLDRLLRGETVTSSGPYYPITEAVVRPQPVQLPRPPLLVGALGAMTISLAVRYADTWNTWGGVHADEAAAVTAVRRQCSLVDAACERHGRDPDTLRRSLCLYPPFDPWSSTGALDRLISMFLPLGITEYVVYAPPPAKEEQLTRALASVGVEPGR